MKSRCLSKNTSNFAIFLEYGNQSVVFFSFYFLILYFSWSVITEALNRPGLKVNYMKRSEEKNYLNFFRIPKTLITKQWAGNL